MNKNIQGDFRICISVPLTLKEEHSITTLNVRFPNTQAVVRKCCVKKVFLKNSQNSQENTCAGAFIKKETLAQEFSGEFCEIFKNTFFIKQLRWPLL